MTENKLMQWSVMEISIVLAILLSIFSLVSVILLVRGRGQRKIRRALRCLGGAVLSNIKLPDGLDGEIYIDHLVFAETHIVLVSVKHYPGYIYGGEELERWTQVINTSNYPFSNPLRELELKAMALRAVVPDIPVEARVLFAGDCQFPKGKPGKVLLLGELSGKATKSVLSGAMRAAWQKLRQHQYKLKA